MGKLFGTDGVRGKANVYPMTPEFVMKMAQVISGFDLIEKKVAICRDTRISGEMLEAALTAGFLSRGVNVVSLGILPTPVMSFITPFLGVDYSIVISASHNVYSDNGIKILDFMGDKLPDLEIQEIERMLLEEDLGEIKTPEIMGSLSCDVRTKHKYLDMIKKIFGKKQHPLKGLRVVIDCANGAFSDIMPDVFKDFGAGVIVIGNKPDGYNINKDCGSTNIKFMSEMVVKSNAHLGIAVDGDGDRIIVCDEKGNRIDGDQLIAFLGKYFKEKEKLKANTVVATIVSNPGLDRYFSGLGVETVRTAVGERYVVDRMVEIEANIGGEESGHMVLLDYAKTGDGLVVGLIVAKGLLESSVKMSEMFPIFTPMTKKRVDTKFDTKDNMEKAFKTAKFEKAIKDGEAKIEGKGKVLVRKSGTEPKIQVWVWGDDEKFVDEVNNDIASVLQGLEGYESWKNTA